MRKRILALDTATQVLSLAIAEVEGGVARPLAVSAHGPSGPSNSELLPVAIEPLLQEAGLSLSELDGLCVGLGPGAFTGLRISLSTAKGICYARKLPLAGVSSLAAMARAAARLCSTAGTIVPVLDARKGQAYAGFFRQTAGGIEPLFADAERLLDPEALAALLPTLPAPVLLLGEGYFAYRAALDRASEGRRHGAVEGLPATPPALEIAALGAASLGAFDPEALFALEPHYVRPSDSVVQRPAPSR